MKKLLIVALVALFVLGAVGVGYAINPSGPGYAGDVMGMATGRYASDPHRTFRLVRLGPASATVWTSQSVLTAGQIVIWDTTASPFGADGVTVTTTTTSGDARVAGMIVTAVNTRDSSTLSVLGTDTAATTATQDVGLANWGWLQTYGLSAVKATASADLNATGIAAGDAISAGATAGSVSSVNPVASSSTTNTSCGFAEEAIAASGTGYVFLKCS